MYIYIYAVVLSSMEVLNDVFSKDESIGRPDHGVLTDRQEVPNTGIGECNYNYNPSASFASH